MANQLPSSIANLMVLQMGQIRHFTKVSYKWDISLSVACVCPPWLRTSDVCHSAVAADEEDDVGSEESGDILQPEELNIELVKEVDVQDEGETGKEVSKEGEEDESLSTNAVTPGSNEEGKDHQGNLEGNFFKVYFR